MYKKLLIELTNGCNLSCSYCNKFVSKDYNHIDFNKLTSLLNKIKSTFFNNVDLIVFWGGEPFLYNNIQKLFEYLAEFTKDYSSKKPLDIAINTNGLLLHKYVDQLDNLVKNSSENINFIIYISLDGLTKELNSFRKLSEAQISKIKDNILLINSRYKENNKLRVVVSSVLCLQEDNKEDFEDFLDFLVENGVKANFTLQEIFEASQYVKFTNLILKTLTQKINLILKKGFGVCVESVDDDINKILRMSHDFKIYNFLDTSFGRGEEFLLSDDGNINFLNRELKTISGFENLDLWSIIYKDENYIKFISKLYVMLNKYNNRLY